jgi:hypothetical protein
VYPVPALLAVNNVKAAGTVFNPVPPFAIVKALPRVNEDACNVPWKVEAPVIPIPPEVTNIAAEWLATPAKLDVDPNTAAPETPSPVPAFKFPDTPRPPTIVNAPLVDAVELVLEENVAFPVTPRVEEAVSAPTEVKEV